MKEKKVVWIDGESLVHYRETLREHHCIVLEGIPVPAGRFVTLDGRNTLCLGILESKNGAFITLLPEDVTPRKAELSHFFVDTETVQGWRALRTPPCFSFEAALQQSGEILGIEQGVPQQQIQQSGTIEEEAGNTVRVPSHTKEQSGRNAQYPIPYTKDLTELSASGKLPPVYGRDREIQQILTILLKKDRNCPLLLGEPGVGKTAVVEKLASLVGKKEAPEKLRNHRILSLDLSALMSECRYRGDMEKKTAQLVETLMSNPNLLLFVDEIHTLMEARGDIPALEMIKPTLSKGLKLIGATTHSDFKAKISRDSALVRRFDFVFVEEPTPEDTLQILKDRVAALEEHHGVCVKPEILSEVVRLADEYLPEKRRPDKALQLLDKAMAAEVFKLSRRAEE